MEQYELTECPETTYKRELEEEMAALGLDKFYEDFVKNYEAN